MRRRLIVGVALALVVAPFLTGVARAVGSCAWDSETATLTVTPLQGRHSTLRVSGQDILFDGEACAPLGATTATVDLIIVNGSVLDDTFFLEFSGGLFAPGAEVEATGVSEIEFDFELGDQTEEDSVVFGGTAGPDLFGFGVGGANLNADDDVDATFGGVEHVVANVNSGADVVAADGDVVVGGALTIPLGVSGGQGNDTITGGDGNDRLLGREGADTVSGAGGADSLSGGPGPDELSGGTGIDTADYFSLRGGVSVNLTTGRTSGGEGADTLSGIEDVIGSFFGDILFGNQLANRLRGGGGNDRINGRGGPDALRGQRGTRDKVAFVGAPSGVTVSLQGGSAGGWGADSLTGFEEVIGSTHSDRITGDHLSNELDGGGGNDNIRGLGGADRLLGRGGQDTLNGGDGPDTLVGDAAHDVLDGGAGDDRLFGGDGPDLLHGNVGNDALNGGAGTDTCYQDAGSGPETSCEKPLAPSGGDGAASAAARRAIRLASRQVQTSIALAGVGTDRGARSRASRTM